MGVNCYSRPYLPYLVSVMPLVMCRYETVATFCELGTDRDSPSAPDVNKSASEVIVAYVLVIYDIPENRSLIVLDDGS